MNKKIQEDLTKNVGCTKHETHDFVVPFCLLNFVFCDCHFDCLKTNLAHAIQPSIQRGYTFMTQTHIMYLRSLTRASTICKCVYYIVSHIVLLFVQADTREKDNINSAFYIK